MKSEFILLVIVGGFFSALIVFLIILYKPTFPSSVNQFLSQKSSKAVASDEDPVGELKSKIKGLEANLDELSQQQKDQLEVSQDLKAFISTQSAQNISPTSINKSIMAEAHTQGSLFTTTSTSYAPMGMYVNISCPKSCLLWINFYSSSKNLGTPASAQGYANTFGVFLDNSDQSIYSQATYYAASSSTPASINASIPVAPGVHTVDVRAKTTGGTLQSDSSFLQVMAIER